jgi:hypothetical protein
MTGETIQFEKAASEESKREQSTIAFPYLDLEAGVEVAKSIYARGGLGACNLDELAAEMGQTMSGAFRLKTGTAKTFDLVEKEGKSGIKLSDLGRRIVLPDTERAARAEAFLRVPLYEAVFEKYRGHLLPPAKALEREMQGFGVSSKQTDKARQAFERSARQAGYFDSGDDRLVRPRVDTPPHDRQPVEQAPEDVPADKPKDHGGGGGSGGRGGDHHPFIEGLLQELPAKDEYASWTIEAQAEWLEAAAGIFKLLSKKKGKITVSVNDPDQPKNTAADQ